MLSWLGGEPATIWQGDVLALLAEVPDGAVQCVVTSPPYWGLRDYGVEGQIGLERTPGEYVARMVQVFGEVRRVLRDDGVCWLNLGDCYANDGKWGGETGGKQAYLDDASRKRNGREKRLTGLKPKDLVGIPWQVAFALRDDGWWLRMDNVWEKPNPMPESVTDRTTRSHEYVFQLTKAERCYWDQEAAREGAVGGGNGNKQRRPARARGNVHGNVASGIPSSGSVSRNMRSVWTFTSQPYPGAHFATFPPELPRRCIRAATPEGGCCHQCRRPYRRVVEKGAPLAAQQAACGGNVDGEYTGQATKDYAAGGAQNASAVKARILAGMVERKTVGWVPQCACPGSTPTPSLVLDPFSGAGTTGLVCLQEGRRFLGLELNPEYIGLTLDRWAAAQGIDVVDSPGPQHPD